MHGHVVVAPSLLDIIRGSIDQVKMIGEYVFLFWQNAMMSSVWAGIHNMSDTHCLVDGKRKMKVYVKSLPKRKKRVLKKHKVLKNVMLLALKPMKSDSRII